MMFVLLLTGLLVLFRNASCMAENDLQRVLVPGDVVIGGLFPIHNNKVVNNNTIRPATEMCDPNSIDLQVLLYTHAMIYAIEKINNSPPLPEVKIGYAIYDTCSSVSMALRASLSLMKGESQEECLEFNEGYNNTVKAVIGELSSEVSVAVARLLAVPLMTQISYASTSELLSSRKKFPSFFRTVPSDKHQTEAIAQLVNMFNFVPVGIIGSEDEYGKYGAETLSDYFNKYNICVEFKLILPADFSAKHSMLTELEQRLASSRAEAIVLFTKESNAMTVLETAIKTKVKRTWIASDAWSTSQDILELKNLQECGKILGITCKRKKVPSFLEYMEDFITRSNTSYSFFHNFSSSPFCSTGSQDQDCSSFTSDPVNQIGGQNCINKKCLIDFIKQDESYESYSIYMAVNVIAQGLKGLLQNGTHFPSWRLTESIKETNFSIDNTSLTLTADGEVDIGYDILEWKTETSKKMDIIGTFNQSGIQFLNLEVLVDNNTVTQFNCSKFCDPGYEFYMLYPDKPCCKGCRKCEENFFSTDGIKCELCKDLNSTQCERNEDFLAWTDGFSITLAVFATSGLIVTLIVIVLFVIYSHTPIVRAAGGFFCFPALFSLLGCFISAFLFLGKPTAATCRAGLPMFSLAFTVCVSCILANLLQISVGFTFKLKLGDWLKRVNKPAVVVLACTSVQAVMCTIWLVLYPPFLDKDSKNEGHIILGCDEGSITMFVISQVYIALLCAICFLFAYSGRRLPDLYKNARFITISMLIHLVVWILFIPIYIQDHEKRERAIEVSAILVSGYGILGCHFAPKCYILLWKKELNDENRIAEYIRNHYENKGIRVLS